MNPSAGHSPDGTDGAPEAAAPARVGLLADRKFVEVRFGGSGGQGVVLMGMILAVAANCDQRCVVQTELYGPEARGGFSRSDVIISDDPIDYPKLDNADVLVALSQDSANASVGSRCKVRWCRYMARACEITWDDMPSVPTPTSTPWRRKSSTGETGKPLFMLDSGLLTSIESVSASSFISPDSRCVPCTKIDL